MQSARMVTLPFILFELFSFELCASQKLCPLYNLKTTQAIFTKLYTNINKHKMTLQSARIVTLPFILFELFPFELCASQKSCPLYNFMKLYTNINQHEMMCRVQEW